MNAVIDASAAIKVVLKQGDYEQTEALIKTFEKTLAPSLFIAEVANALWRYVVAGAISSEGATVYLDAAIAMIDEFVGSINYATETLQASIKFNHSIYDMLYLTLARRNGAVLVSLDKKLNSLAAREGIAVR
jgi:predicted nucleic acid-binding protein